MGDPLRESVKVCGALLGDLLGYTLDIRTTSHPARSGPVTDGARIWIPLTWLRRWGITDHRVVCGIIAHEAAHAIPPQALGKSEELRADWLGGYALGRLGVDASAFASLLRRLPSGPEHPIGWVRTSLARQGWAEGIADLRKRGR